MTTKFTDTFVYLVRDRHTNAVLTIKDSQQEAKLFVMESCVLNDVSIETHPKFNQKN